MASQASDVTATCLICFETRALKIVGNCKHSFCTECLSTVFDSLESSSEVFACPSCKVDCPRPWDGVLGLVDFTGNTADAVDTNPEVSPEEIDTESKEQELFDAICDLCNHKHKKVPAANICSDCYHLHICRDCTTYHRQNKATQAHTLTPIATKCWKKEAMCEVHHKLLLSFCKTCSEPICTLCVSLDHGDHDIEKLADTIQSNVEVVRGTLGLREVKLAEMQELEKQLTLLNAMTPIVDKQDTLINEIEDHAQKRIDQIVQCKEDLKAQVKMDFKIVREIPECLQKVREAVQQLQPPINGATQLLSGIEHHPSYLDKLKVTQQGLEAVATTSDDVKKGKKFGDQLLKLNSDDHSFAPKVKQTVNLGKICKSPKTEDFKPKEIFCHKMQVDSADMYIPCVAVLGPKYYAVAHPVKPGQPAEAIDIYEFPGKWIKTLTDNVSPLYDMTSTPQGKLAVLSNGTADNSCSVKLFDAETGYISSTRDIGIAKPMSLGVTLHDQYVILGQKKKGGPQQITVVDKDGGVKHKHVIDQDYFSLFSTRITCGGKFIFLTRGRKVAVYKIQDTGLEAITVCPPQDIVMGDVIDVSATIWDELILTDIAQTERQETDNVYLTRLQDKENKLEWQESLHKIVHRDVKGADSVARVSTRDGHTVVMSHGQTIKVFKC